MLKKYTSNKILSLMNYNKDNKEIPDSAKKVKKLKKSKNPKNSEEKNNSQIKNSIFSKIIIKSNSIIQNNNNEHYLLNYKNKMSIKNSPILPKSNNQTKDKTRLKTKIKTTFSNYYTDFIFKNNNKSNFNFTEINYAGEDTEELSNIHFNNEINEDSLQTNRLKYLRLYNIDSSQKIEFNTCINNSYNNSKDYSYNKGSILISPKNNKKINKDKKALENSNKKLSKIRAEQNSETKIYIFNSSNKNLNNLGDTNKKNKTFIKQKKNNVNGIKNKKIENKENKKKIFDSNNKTSKKKNIITKHEKHIFLSPMQKNINNIIVKIKSSTKKLNKVSQNNNLSNYNITYSTSNKENKKIIFQKKQNNNIDEQNKKKQNKNTYININNQMKDKFQKLNIKTHTNVVSFKNDLEINNLETDIYKLMNEHKELTPTIISEDKTTEKDLYLENNNIEIKNDKNFIDYFETARKALKSMSHSLVEPNAVNNLKNSKFFDNEIKKRIKEGQKSIRNKEDELHNYSIKKVPIFAGINMFPQKKIKFINNTLFNIFCRQTKCTIKENILNFLNNKSIMCLSSINKDFYTNIRKIFYLNIYNKICENKDNKFVKKINESVFDIVSKKLKKNKSQLESMYDSLGAQTKYIDIILNDLSRTFPYDKKFQKNSINYKKLYNILTKYSNYNPVIGYAQGLNFLFANALYLYDNEKSAFFYIDGLITRFGLENYLAEKNPKLTIEINKFGKILSKYIPDIINDFDKKLVNHEFFSTGWILTLFSNSMNSENLFVCWNFMIIFGWKFFYCFVIQILTNYKYLIFNTNENGLSQLMKSILKDEKFNQDLPKIINKTLLFMCKNILL